MARFIISDAGPLIAFSGIDSLFVLQELFSEISIVEAVRRECLAKPGTDSQRIETAIKSGWIKICASGVATEPLSSALGNGESDSIRFALESPTEALFIVDDRLARRFALKQSVNIIGTVRILDLAEQRGLINSACKCIASMTEIGYRISSELLSQVRLERQARTPTP